jgi:hypothetical protein
MSFNECHQLVIEARTLHVKLHNLTHHNREKLKRVRSRAFDRLCRRIRLRRKV